MTINDPNSRVDVTLSPDDQRVLDALVEAGFDPSMIESPSPAAKARVDAISSLLGAMKDYPVDDCEPALIDATLARIDRYERERAAQFSFDMQQEKAARGSGRRIRMPDF